MIQTTNAVVAIMARRAELGEGKTRLASTLGAGATLEAYRRLIARTAETAVAARLPATVYFEPEPGDFEVWTPEFFAYDVQPRSASLGARIEGVLRAVLAQAEPDCVGAIVVGTDCPYLEASHLTEAARLLEHHEMVLGPARDGGYYLLGVRAPNPALFEGIDWSTERVAEQTLAAAASLNWSVAQLETLEDVDTESEWRRYLRTLT